MRTEADAMNEASCKEDTCIAIVAHMKEEDTEEVDIEGQA
jgi:hypothetical protein